jgi:hypothetical protein
MTGKRLSTLGQLKPTGISAMENTTQDRKNTLKLTSEEEELYIDTSSHFPVTNNGSARFDTMDV